VAVTGLARAIRQLQPVRSPETRFNTYSEQFKPPRIGQQRT
jgi:hypothetical protein